jgi:peptide/nickel transport system substrate-binding protein
MVFISACRVGGDSSPAAQATSEQQLALDVPPTAVAATRAPETQEQQAQPTNAGETQGNGMTAGPAASTTPAPQISPENIKQAPQLDRMVEEGKLPAVAERVPSDPMVLRPVESIGRYGGTWDNTYNGDAGTFIRQIGYEYLVRWKRDVRAFSADEVIPNVAESVETSPDGTEYTFKLREGMKWSDGKPFTADDIVFWYEDILMNKELTPALPGWLDVGDKPLRVSKRGDDTVVFKFSAPNGLFLQNMASGANGMHITGSPAHYLKQFLPKYNPRVEQEAKQAKQPDWMTYFWSKHDFWGNKDKPTLYGWLMTVPVGANTQRIVAERNPYYWKVDTEGNQLPYLDRIVYTVTDDPEVVKLKALNGELDVAGVENADKPVFFDNQEKGGYHFFESVPTSMNNMMFALNLAHKDKTMRGIFQNKDFRIGLSHAINRPEMISLLYVEQGEPYQGAPRPDSPFRNEQLAKQYTEYSVQKANEHLDKVLPNKNAQGMRLGPDGKPFYFQAEVINRVKPWVDSLQLMSRYFKDVGIDMRVKAEDETLFRTRQDGNLLDAAVWGGDGGLDVMLEPRWYFPYSGESLYAVPWAAWFNNPKDKAAVEPPPAAKRQMQLYRQLTATADPDEQKALMNQILQIAQDEFWAIGTVLSTPSSGIVKNNFHNHPKAMLSSWLWPTPGPSDPVQYWEGEK